MGGGLNRAPGECGCEAREDFLGGDAVAGEFTAEDRDDSGAVVLIDGQLGFAGAREGFIAGLGEDAQAGPGVEQLEGAAGKVMLVDFLEVADFFPQRSDLARITVKNILCRTDEGSIVPGHDEHGTAILRCF